jgi:hypothetical protein
LTLLYVCCSLFIVTYLSFKINNCIGCYPSGHPQGLEEHYSFPILPYSGQPSHHIVNKLYLSYIFGVNVPTYFTHPREINNNSVKLVQICTRYFNAGESTLTFSTAEIST